MAFTLVINRKGLFGKVKSIQMVELLKNCGLKYGSNNELAKEIERQFKKASFYCTEENRNYTMDELENKEEAMAAFSQESLQRFCNDLEMKQCILTLALYPWFMEPEKREYYKTCPDLDDFEETIHELQAGDFYYAKPSLMKNKNDGKVLAV